MLQIYVAGRYRGPTRDAIELNIQAARHIGRLCLEKGWYPQIPCNNTNHFEHLLPDVDDQVYIEGTLEMMRRCDAVVLIPGWRQSKGAVGEVQEAIRLGMPIFYTIDNLPNAKEFTGPFYQGKTPEGLEARQDAAGIITKVDFKVEICDPAGVTDDQMQAAHDELDDR